MKASRRIVATGLAVCVMCGGLAEPAAERRECPHVCVVTERVAPDRDDNTHRDFGTEYVGTNGTVVQTTGGTPVFGRAMDMPHFDKERHFAAIRSQPLGSPIALLSTAAASS